MSSITRSEIERFIAAMRKDFPFPEKLPVGDYSYLNVCKIVNTCINPGAEILDFGSGPCDKTVVLSKMGYKCYACDDLNDNWHKESNNRNLIMEFARINNVNFRLVQNSIPDFADGKFDMIMLHDVIEHLHESPKNLLERLKSFLKPGGYFFITVPNAVNIRKRLAVLFGRTNLPPFDEYYSYQGIWRGHIREYVKDDLVKLCRNLGLEKVELRGCDNMLEKVPRILHRPYLAFTNVFDGLKDSLLLLAKKTEY
ncbi:MAG: hypothetical protein Kow0029_22160 [Candidatus Rifleibacteriota bacterium]